MALPGSKSSSVVEERVPMTPQQKAKRLAEIDVALNRSHLRTLAYKDAGDDSSLLVQEAVTDRLLRERFELQK